MTSGKSIEQITEEYSRDIFERRHKIIDDFFVAYAAHIMIEKGEMISLDDLCVIEQEGSFKEGCLQRKWWIEYKPKFDE